MISAKISFLGPIVGAFWFIPKKNIMGMVVDFGFPPGLCGQQAGNMINLYTYYSKKNATMYTMLIRSLGEQLTCN